MRPAGSIWSRPIASGAGRAAVMGGAMDDLPAGALRANSSASRPGPKRGRRADKVARNARIAAEFDGSNWLELSRRWGLSERMIRYIVSGR